MLNLRDDAKIRLGRFVELYGWRGILTIPFYPIITLATTPVRLIQTLWHSRILLNGNGWSNYPHFHPISAINSLFYWTAALNLYRYGRTGVSPTLGLGNFKLSQLFHYSLPSLYAYWKAGAVGLLASMFGWWSINFVWLNYSGLHSIWIVIILVLTLFSTSFYIHTFKAQNYNAIGWLFLPAVLYGWKTSNWSLASLALLAVSMGSISVVFFACLLAPAYAFESDTIAPILTLIPAAIKISTHFWANVVSSDFFSSCTKILKAIGTSKCNANYVRKGTMIFDLKRFYHLILYIQFIAAFTIQTGSPPIVLVTAVGIWLINSLFFRFADDQSTEMLVLTVSVTVTLSATEINIWTLLSFVILVSPLPIVHFRGLQNAAVVPKLKPFNIRPIIDEFKNFLAPIKSGQKVLMAFNNPKKQYEKIFDGYRLLLEIPLYVSAIRNIHFMPDWWGIFDLNFEGAPDFWGRDLDALKLQMKRWNSNYAVIYQKHNSRLEKNWIAAGFTELSHLSCSALDACWGDDNLYAGPGPELRLLEFNSK